MNRVHKFNKLFILFLILFISIGFAIISTSLTINGVSSILGNTWDVHFENVQVSEGSVSANAPTITNSNTTVSFNITLDMPGDYYEFTVDAVNAGTIDAMLDSLVVTGLDGYSDILDYKITYESGMEINRNDLLSINDRRTILVKIEYKRDIDENDLPDHDLNISISITENYVQADSNANFVSRNLKEYIMYELNGDMYNIYKNELTTRLADSSASAFLLPENIELAQTYMDMYDKLKDNLDWENTGYFQTKINSSNYSQFPDGIYVDNERVIPFFHKTGLPDSNNIDPNMIRGYSFTKPVTGDLIKNTKYLDKADGEMFIEAYPYDNDILDIFSNNYINLTKYYDSNRTIKLEYFNYNYSLSDQLTRYGGGTSYLYGGLYTEPYCFGANTILLDGKFDLVNSLILIYDFNNSFKGISHVALNKEPEGKGYQFPYKIAMIKCIKDYVELANSYGYINDTWNNVINGTASSKIKQLLTLSGVSNEDLSYFTRYLQHPILDISYLQVSVNTNDPYYSYYSNLRDEFNHDNNYDSITNDSSKLFSTIIGDMKIKYLNNYYEGIQGFYNFIIDYEDINVSLYSDIYEAVDQWFVSFYS